MFGSDVGPSPVGALGQPMRESEVDFWARQFSEHALFFSLGIEDKVYRAQAEALHAAWERARPTLTAVTILPLCTELRAYKVDLFAQLQRRWLGWIFPTFVDHTRRELDLFVSHAVGNPLTSADVGPWLQFMAEHAAFAAHLMDPIEAQRIRGALAAVGTMTELRAACTRGVNDQILALSRRAGEDLDRFTVNDIAKAKGVIHPVLATHVVREGRRFLYTVDRLRARQ